MNKSKKRNKIFEKISWIPYKTVYSLQRKIPKKELINLNKIGISEEIVFNYIKDDEGLSKQLSIFGFREPLNWRYYYEFINKEDIVLDVGANIGLFSILSKNAKKIICIEPIKECIPVLKKNLKDNKLKDKSVVINKAVGKKGKLYLKKDNHVNLSKVVEKKERDAQEISSENLNYFIKKYSSNVLRMDVEGYEYDILYKKTPQQVTKIALEFHTSLLGKEKSKKILNYLDEEGFKIKYLIEDLPLRFYPFFKILKKTGLIKKFTYIKKNPSFYECLYYISKGRSIKYIFLQRK